jgi:MFS family permease
VRSVPVALLCRLLAGFGTALYGVARHAYVAEAVRAGSRGRAISLFGGLNRIGRFAGPFVGGQVAAWYGLPSTFLAYGIASVLALIVMAVYVRPPEASTAAQVSSASARLDETARAAAKGSIWALFRAHGRVLAPAGMGQLFAQTIRAGRTAIIPLYAADVIGLDVRQIGLIVSLSSAIDMSLFVVAGLLMDRLGRKYAIVPSFLIQALAMALVPLTGSFYSLLGVTLLLGFGNGLGSGTMMTLGADLSPSESRDEFLGIWRLIGDGGHAGGPYVVGQVAEWVALPVSALVMSGAGLAAALVFLLLVPETLKTHHAAARTPQA